MRILFLTPQLPYPPRQGTQIRNFHLIRAAAGAHRVDLLSFARPGENLESAGPLRELCGKIRLVPAPRRTMLARLSTMLISIEPDMAHRLRSRDFTTSLTAILESGGYDAVQVEGIELAQYVPTIRKAVPDAAVIFDDHNAEYLLQWRAALVDLRYPPAWHKGLYSLVQAPKLLSYESRLTRAVHASIAVSEADGLALATLGTRQPIYVVPNGVDTDYYQPAPTETEPATLLFTGTMDFRPNVDAMRWFASRVLPRVLAHRPDARLEIVGRSPSPSVVALASRTPAVRVVGPVEDVRPHFRRATAFVVPMRMGGGVRLKVLEALAAGVAVVSTTMGADGTGLAPNDEIILADSAPEFARAVLRLLEDADLRQRLALAGRRAAEERFDWSHIAPLLLRVYDDIGKG